MSTLVGWAANPGNDGVRNVTVVETELPLELDGESRDVDEPRRHRRVGLGRVAEDRAPGLWSRVASLAAAVAGRPDLWYGLAGVGAAVLALGRVWSRTKPIEHAGADD